jgi:hypothetical protein
LNAESNPNPASRWSRFAPLACILLAAAVAAAPILIHGPVGGDDFEFHFVSWRDAQHGWLDGILYPHWAASPNYGAGEPRFVFYPPLTWMLGAALGLALPWTLVPVAMTFVLLAATGFAVRALALEFLPGAPATLAGCAALFSGYALYAAYNRTAFAEMAGGFWIPLLLLFALRDRNPSSGVLSRALDGSTLPLALVVAGAWLSDAPLGVIASYLLAGGAAIAAITARAWYPMVRAAIAAFLGMALTGVWLIPAAWQQRWIDIQQVTGAIGDPGLRIENNWIFPHHADPALHGRDLSLRAISWISAQMLAVAFLGLGVLWRRRRLGVANGPKDLIHGTGDSTMPRRLWIPLAFIPAIVLFLQLPVSLPFWNLLPKLRYLQFPWRWPLAVEAPMGIFFAAAVWPGGSRRRWLHPLIGSLCALAFIGSTLYAAQHFFRDGTEEGDMANLIAKYDSGAGFFGTDEYAPPGADNSLVATGLPGGCLTDRVDQSLGVELDPRESPAWRPEQHSCISTATETVIGPEHLRFQGVAARAGFMILRLRSYPAWRIAVNGRPVTGLESRQDGLTAVPVPQGSVTVTADWTTTPDVIAGRCASLLAIALLIALSFVERRLARRQLA